MSKQDNQFEDVFNRFLKKYMDIGVLDYVNIIYDINGIAKLKIYFNRYVIDKEPRVYDLTYTDNKELITDINADIEADLEQTSYSINNRKDRIEFCKQKAEEIRRTLEI